MESFLALKQEFKIIKAENGKHRGLFLVLMKQGVAIPPLYSYAD